MGIKTTKEKENTLLKGVIISVIGGSILSILPFIFTEYVFAKPVILGKWKLKEKVYKSTYHPYLKLSAEINIILQQQDLNITGSGEKIKEIDSNGKPTVYPPELRPLWDITGTIDRNYFSKSNVFLYITETGARRKITIWYKLKRINKDSMSGTFKQTGDIISGEVSMTRDTTQ